MKENITLMSRFVSAQDVIFSDWCLVWYLHCLSLFCGSIEFILSAFQPRLYICEQIRTIWGSHRLKGPGKMLAPAASGGLPELLSSQLSGHIACFYLFTSSAILRFRSHISNLRSSYCCKGSTFSILLWKYHTHIENDLALQICVRFKEQMSVFIDPTKSRRKGKLKHLREPQVWFTLIFLLYKRNSSKRPCAYDGSLSFLINNTIYISKLYISLYQLKHIKQSLLWSTPKINP